MVTEIVQRRFHWEKIASFRLPVSHAKRAKKNGLRPSNRLQKNSPCTNPPPPLPFPGFFSEGRGVCIQATEKQHVRCDISINRHRLLGKRLSPSEFWPWVLSNLTRQSDNKYYFHVACLDLPSLPGRDAVTCPVLDLESLSPVSWPASSSSYLIE